MKLLKKLCEIHAPSGDESLLTNFILNYIEENKKKWKQEPEVFYGDQFQDCIVLVFGKPKTAIFAHLDSIGFSVKYNNQIVKIGSPSVTEGDELIGLDSKGKIEGKITIKQDKKGKKSFYLINREIDRGTTLTFKPKFKEDTNYVQCCYMDNRLGVWNALQVAKTLENGVICFSCWEEHGGGSVGYLAKFIYETYGVRQALISDITWITEGVQHGRGAAISIRDSALPRRSFVNKIINLAKESNIDFQIEVEDAGGSDGNELQKSPYPFDWCFIGAAEENVHSPKEKVHKKDIQSMLDLYNYLMKKL